MSILANKLDTATVAMIAEIDGATIQNWIRRGHITGHREVALIEGGGIQGKRRSFSWFAAMEITVAARLIDAGCTPPRAFAAALQFSHVGNGSAGWTGDGIQHNEPKRRPGLPFHHIHGETILVVHGDTNEVVLSVDGKFKLTTYVHGARRDQAIILLNVSEVFNGVATRLGYHPYTALDDAYTAAA